ncbi:MAG: COX15/CtaA family protein [Nitrososphaerales archaeon]|nr:COX15/CtaA family protein [Nitrososphaerales archaeon]
MHGRTVMLAYTLFFLFAVIVVGAYVAAGDYGEACGSQVPADWPLCNGNLFPPAQVGPIVEYSHRLLAALSSLFLFVTTFLYWRAATGPNPSTRALIVASLLLLFQIFLGALVVAQNLGPALVALHQATATLIFGFAVAALAMDTD